MKSIIIGGALLTLSSAATAQALVNPWYDQGSITSGATSARPNGGNRIGGRIGSRVGTTAQGSMTTSPTQLVPASPADDPDATPFVQSFRTRSITGSPSNPQ